MSAVAQLKALLGMDNKQFKAGMRQSESQAKSFQSSIASIGRTIAVAFSIGAVVAFSKKIIDFASEIRHTADNLNTSTDALQALNSISLKYGMTVEGLHKGMGKLRQSQGKVAEGDKEYTDAVELLNINLKEFGKADTARALELLAKGYAAAGGSALAFSAVQDLMGRSAKKATAFMMELSKTGLEGMISNAKDAGTVIEEDIITKLEFAGTRLEQLGLQFKVWGADLIGVLATAGEAWNGYTRAQAKAQKELVGLSPSAKADAKRLGLTGEPGQVGAIEGADAKTLDKLKAKLNSLRDALLFGRMDKREQLIDLEARLSELSTKNATTETARLNIVIERFKVFEKILKLRKDIESAASKTAAKDQKALDRITGIQDASVKRIAALSAPGAVHGRGLQTDSLASVGGFIGPQRPGLAIADRQFQINKERNVILQKTSDDIRIIKENTSPTGGL